MAKDKSGKSESDDLVELGLDDFKRCNEGAKENHQTYKEDLRFARDEDQWPANVRKMREDDGRPMLTINKLGAFGKQVVNDARQNKPSVKVHPADSEGDVETAEIYNGLIRNIESSSNADVAYDTAIENAVWGGFGYWRVGLDYAYDDTFDQDITIKRVPNPLSVLGDPDSTDADSCDWNVAFVVDWLTNAQFEDAYGDKAKVDWEADDTWKDAKDWHDDKGIQIAEWWSRKTVEKPIILLSNGQVTDKASLTNDDDLQAMIAAGVVSVKGERTARSYEVRQRIMSGVEVLKDTVWLGKYIPIVPVYGDEFNLEGKRFFRSLIHPAIDAQRMFNYWRSITAEVAAYTPRVPYIGPVGAFATDPNWATANTRSHAYLEYDVEPIKAGGGIPQRQPLDMGTAAGALQEALNASDDIKSTIGMYDASIGARSNETSGKAIMARQREGDVATFHFTDNLTRAIRHTGRILIDIIPKVYNTRRMVRILGEDGKHSNVALKQDVPVMGPDGKPKVDEQGNPMTRVFDLGVGKYDLTVSSGPSFTTRREEAAASMTELIRSYPESAPVIAPRLAKNLDWPGADEIAADFEKLSPLNEPQIPPELQQQIEEGKAKLDEQAKQIDELKASTAADVAKVEAQKQIELLKISGNEQVESAKLASEERIAQAKIASEERIAIAKARLQAEATIAATAMKPAPAPTGPRP
jgi:hypothetical protein